MCNLGREGIVEPSGRPVQVDYARSTDANAMQVNSHAVLLAHAEPPVGVSGFRTTGARQITFLAFGDAARIAFAARGAADLVADAAAAEAVALLAPLGGAELHQFLDRRGLGLAPVVDLSGAAAPRADYTATEIGPRTLEEAVAIAAQILERTAELSPIPPGADAAGLLALALAYTRARPLEAAYGSSRPEIVFYPLLDTMPDARRVLEGLADAGLLRRRFFDRLHVCAGCGSSRLNVREECPACRSSHLLEATLVHHYACGHQAQEDVFRDGDALVCPKCRKRLRHYGVDYDRPGRLVVCKGCGAHASEPEVGFLCTDCGAHTPGERAAVRDWHHYDLLPEAVAALRAGALPCPNASSSRSLPVRNFLLLARHELEVARRYGRRISMGRIRIDEVKLRERLTVRDLEAVRRLIAEMVEQGVRSSDFIAAVPDGLAIMLPEATAREAEVALARLRRRLAEGIGPSLSLCTEVVADNDGIGRLLDALK
jgi:Thaumarchaeal output domain 1